MPLADFQTSLGLSIRASSPDGQYRVTLSEPEQASLAALRRSRGFEFTIRVQRSWCAGRAGKAAYLTMSILPEARRTALLDAWVESGGGTMSFVGAEAAAFLRFVSGQFAERSHERSVCEFEMAALRAAEGLADFEPADLCGANSGTLVGRGRYAGLAKFHGDPNVVLDAMLQRRQLPLAESETALLFGPGLPGLHRRATLEEAALYDRLGQPSPVGDLLKQGWRQDLLADWLRVGLLDRCVSG